jgi:hypothetical protein
MGEDAVVARRQQNSAKSDPALAGVTKALAISPMLNPQKMCKNKRDLGLLCELGMARGEHHSKLIVLDRVRSEKLVDQR